MTSRFAWPFNATFPSAAQISSLKSEYNPSGKERDAAAGRNTDANAKRLTRPEIRFDLRVHRRAGALSNPELGNGHLVHRAFRRPFVAAFKRFMTAPSEPPQNWSAMFFIAFTAISSRVSVGITVTVHLIGGVRP